MTHAELLTGRELPPITLPPGALECPAEVKQLRVMQESYLDREGQMRERIISIHHCPLCHANIVVDDQRTLINQYESHIGSIREVDSAADAR